jgi:biopolymer transport protein ExbD
MRFTYKKTSDVHEADFTPMIDIVFQLIAFFMVLINFTQTEQNDKIKLPESLLARPPDAPLEFPITLHMSEMGTVFIGGQEVSLQGLRPYLRKEATILQNRNTPVADATVIIRADRFTATGEVQNLIRVCQDNGFEKFSLRATERVGN